MAGREEGGNPEEEKGAVPLCIPDDRTAMALCSAARSTSLPPIPEVYRRTGREGVAQLGVSRHGRPFVVCASVAERLPLPDSAPPSAPVSAARRSAGGLARAFRARHARSWLRGGGGGGDGARRGGRLFVFLARLGLAAGGAGSVWILPRFFSRSVRIPDARGRFGRSSTGRAGVVRRSGATETRGVYYFCLLRAEGG